MHWIKSKTVPKVKQPGENISIKYIHNYAAETNFENFVDGEKKFQDFSSIPHFPRTVFSKQFWFPGLSRTSGHLGCDNGSNFVGVERVGKIYSIEEMNHSKIQSLMLSQNAYWIVWKRNIHL